jgi:hypothetical protein
MKKLMLALIVLMFIFPFTYTYSQEIEGPTYNLEFIKANYTQKRKKNKIVLYFKYEKKEDEMALISTKLTYNIGDGKGDVVEILEESKHSIIVNGTENIKEDNVMLFLELGYLIDFDTEKELYIFEFHLRNITKKYIDKMTFKYGLYEPSNPEIRIETEYEIEIDNKSSS